MNNPLVQPDPGLFIWTILTFLVLLALLAKFAWRPLLQALDSRQETIRKSLDDAQQAKQELERLQQESAQIIRQARVEAEAIIAQSRVGRRAAPGRAAAEGAGRSRRHRPERRAADPAGDGAGAAADPPRSGRPVGGDRVEDHPAEPLEGRQRAADRGRLAPDRKPPPLKPYRTPSPTTRAPGSRTPTVASPAGGASGGTRYSIIISAAS